MKEPIDDWRKKDLEIVRRGVAITGPRYLLWCKSGVPVSMSPLSADLPVMERRAVRDYDEEMAVCTRVGGKARDWRPPVC